MSIEIGTEIYRLTTTFKGKVTNNYTIDKLAHIRLVGLVQRGRAKIVNCDTFKIGYPPLTLDPEDFYRHVGVCPECGEYAKSTGDEQVTCLCGKIVRPDQYDIYDEDECKY